jgi:hypothetical protein
MQATRQAWIIVEGNIAYLFAALKGSDMPVLMSKALIVVPHSHKRARCLGACPDGKVEA